MLNLFNSDRNDVNRTQLLEYKRAYKTLINKKKKEYNLRKVTELESLKNKKPKDFWKYFKSKGKKTKVKLYH